MASALALTEKEAELVREVLQYWRDGLEDAKDATIKDARTLDTLEKMLDATRGYAETERLLAGILNRMDQIWSYNVT